MKYIATIFFCLFMLVTAMTGCSKARTQTDAPASDKISVVCTIFPQYDWARQILGEKAGDVELTMLLNSGVDLHSFQPAVADIIKISTCDLFIYVGGESDAWVEDALKEAQNPNMIVINLLDTLGDNAKIETVIEGMQDDEEHEHASEEEHSGEQEHASEEEHGGEQEHASEEEHGGEQEHASEEEHGGEQEHASEEEHSGEQEHASEEEHSGEHEAVYDGHVWLSLKNAEIFCAAIAEALSSLDAENAGEYQNNMTAYIAELETLDTKYQQAVEAAATKTLLFCDRFPFRYLLDEYGLSYHAAFPGCSAETEASFDTIMFLADKASELNLNAVMVTESADQSIAKTVISNTDTKNQQIFILNSLQSVTQSNVESGETYLSIMEDNLNTLAEVLD